MSSKKSSGIQFPPLKKLYTKGIKDPLDDVEVEERNVVLEGEEEEDIYTLPDVEVPVFWTDNALKICAQKYFVDGVEKSILDMIRRVVGSMTEMKM